MSQLLSDILNARHPSGNATVNILTSPILPPQVFVDVIAFFVGDSTLDVSSRGVTYLSPALLFAEAEAAESINLNLSGNTLTGANIDSILTSLSSLFISGGVLDISGSSMGSPTVSAAAIPHADGVITLDLSGVDMSSVTALEFKSQLFTLDASAMISGGWDEIHIYNGGNSSDSNSFAIVNDTASNLADSTLDSSIASQTFHIGTLDNPDAYSILFQVYAMGISSILSDAFSSFNGSGHTFVDFDGGLSEYTLTGTGLTETRAFVASSTMAAGSLNFSDAGTVSITLDPSAPSSIYSGGTLSICTKGFTTTAQLASEFATGLANFITQWTASDSTAVASGSQVVFTVTNEFEYPLNANTTGVANISETAFSTGTAYVPEVINSDLSSLISSGWTGAYHHATLGTVTF